MEGIILETERLWFRRLVIADFEPLYALYRDPEVRHYFPDGTPCRMYALNAPFAGTNGAYLSAAYRGVCHSTPRALPLQRLPLTPLPKFDKLAWLSRPGVLARGRIAEIAQLVEHATENRGVPSSILGLGTLGQ